MSVLRIQDGPASPISPQTDTYYSALAKHDCDHLSTLLLSALQATPDDPETLLFSALDALCFAVRDPRRTVDWTKIETADHASAALGTNCLHVAAHRALHQVLVLHRANPAAPPTFARPPKGTACRPVIRAAALIDDPAISSTPYLLVVGDHLFQVGRIGVAGVTRAASPVLEPNWVQGQDCGAAVLLAPPDLRGRDTARIRVTGAGYTTDYLWHIGPVVPAGTDPHPPDDACTIVAPTTTASPSP